MKEMKMDRNDLKAGMPVRIIKELADDNYASGGGSNFKIGDEGYIYYVAEKGIRIWFTTLGMAFTAQPEEFEVIDKIDPDKSIAEKFRYGTKVRVIGTQRLSNKIKIGDEGTVLRTGVAMDSLMFEMDFPSVGKQSLPGYLITKLIEPVK
jgi:hypothetical protein